MGKTKFRCTTGCSDCCIKREYYPDEPYGKIGVLLLPEEKSRIEQLASELGVPAKVLPRIALGKHHEKIIAYQLMGARDDGDYCPFLDSSQTSPHGGKSCRIYSNRPLACMAYPVIDIRKNKADLDANCSFCSLNGNSASVDGLEDEREALAKIKSNVRADHPEEPVWRYATATGSSTRLYAEGWIKDDET